jgi:uncharacterized iron-regulated protein
MTYPRLALLFVPLFACASPSDPADDESSGAAETGEEGTVGTGDAPTTTGDDGTSTGEPGTSTGDEGGQSFPDPADAPKYGGESFASMQIYDVAGDVWLDELALMEALDPARAVFVGEQHTLAPTHELELWVLERMLARHDDVALAMEQFQRDEQPVIDAYLAGEIDGAAFEAMAQPWDEYAKYWKPLVEAARAAGRPVLALNVPDEALDGIYAMFPESPLAVFNAWGGDHPYDGDVAPRPLAMWDALYQGYFAGSYDYESHGKDWGLTYEEALAYFTDLALIRDDTMGFFVADHLEATGERVVVVAGDWHVQTGVATPDSVAKFADVETRRITTATPNTLETVLGAAYEGRAVADFVLVYTPG